MDEPEEIERISPMDKGLLMHSVLCSFLEQERPSPSKTKAQLARLMEIASEECDSFEHRGLTGYPLLWRHDREEILADLAAWYRTELEDPESAGYDDAALEVRFGRPYPGEQTGRLSRDEPILLDLGGARIRVHGRIDRLEWRARERFRVIDYKTGSSWGRPGDNAVNGGRSLQLPVYMIAGAELLSISPEHGSAQYFYASRRGQFRRARFDGTELGDARQGVRGLLGELVAGIRAGDFHAEPSGDACHYCDFDGVCDASRERNLETKERRSARRAIRAARRGPSMSTKFVPADEATRAEIRTLLDESMCVEAGAGTGKTSVLVDRVVELLCRGPYGVDDIAVMTFTDAAAAELAARVREKLETALVQSTEPAERARLEDALLGLYRAQIETIHAFATNVLRERPVEAGLDPRFAVLDPLGAAQRFEDAWRAWLDETLSSEAPEISAAINRGLDIKQMRAIADAVNTHRYLLPLIHEAPSRADVDGFAAMLQRVAGELDDLRPACADETDGAYLNAGNLIEFAAGFRNADASERERLILSGAVAGAERRAARQLE